MRKSYFQKIIICPDTAFYLADSILKEKLAESFIDLLNPKSFSHYIRNLFLLPEYNKILLERLNIRKLYPNHAFIFHNRDIYNHRFLFESLPFIDMSNYFEHNYPTPVLFRLNCIRFESVYADFFKEAHLHFEHKSGKMFFYFDQKKIARCTSRNSSKIKHFLRKNIDFLFNELKKEHKLYNESEYDDFFMTKYQDFLLQKGIDFLNITIERTVQQTKEGYFDLPTLHFKSKLINYDFSYSCSQISSNRSDFAQSHFYLKCGEEIEKIKELHLIQQEKSSLNILITQTSLKNTESRCRI